jgi:multidrug efflux system outer membrane protein
MQTRPSIPLAALMTALLAAGCTSLAPDYQRPALPVADQFVEASMAGTTASAELPWHAFFKDARLQSLIRLALVNNRDLRIAVLNVSQATAQARARGADVWPTVNAGVTGLRQPASSGAITSTYTAGLNVTAYELDLFGRLQSLSQAAQAQVLASAEARKTVQIALVTAVANTNLSLAADEELVRIARETVGTREASLQLVQLKFDHGAASLLDLSQVTSLIESAKATLALATRQRALDENALTLLVGQPLPADLPPPQTLQNMGQLTDLPAGLPAEVVLRRPDVRQAEQQLMAANANIGAARAAFFPHITLTGSAGVASSDLDSLFNNGASAWSFAPQLLMPIFDAGRNRANLDSAKAANAIAVAQYEKAVQTAFREVSDALAGRSTLIEQLRAQTAQLQAEDKRYQLTDLRQRNGAASALEMLDAQRALFAAQQATVQVRLLQLQNGVALYKALGGGLP